MLYGHSESFIQMVSASKRSANGMGVRVANAMRKTAIRPMSAKARRSYARPVGSYVPKLTSKSMEKHGFSAASLIMDWAEIAGPEMARYALPERLKWPRGVNTYGDVEVGDRGRPGATLMLRVDPARALDVQYSAAQLLERINRYFGYRAVAELRILQAPVNANGLEQPVPAPVPAPAPARAGKAELDEGLIGITDDGLREALRRLKASIADAD